MVSQLVVEQSPGVSLRWKPHVSLTLSLTVSFPSPKAAPPRMRGLELNETHNHSPVPAARGYWYRT